MAGANAVFKAALGRTRAGSSFKSTTGRRSATVSDGSGTLVDSNVPSRHLSGGTVFPTATAERRTFRPFAPKK